MLAKTIVHFEIPANDVDRLSKFYADCFGWKFEKAPMPGMDYWMISTGPMGKSLGGGMYKKQDANQHPTNYVQVDSVDEAVQRLQQAGGSMVMPKQEVMGMGFTALGLDPEGNPVGLWQPLRAPRRPARRTSKAKRRRRR